MQCDLVQRLRDTAVPTVELCDEAADTIERLWGLANEMKAAIETAGFVLRNTDSGPNLVRY